MMMYLEECLIGTYADCNIPDVESASERCRSGIHVDNIPHPGSLLTYTLSRMIPPTMTVTANAL